MTKNGKKSWMFGRRRGNRYQSTSFLFQVFSEPQKRVELSCMIHLKAFEIINLSSSSINFYSIYSFLYFCVSNCGRWWWQSRNEPMPAESFLDRYSLPRIARLIANNVDIIANNSSGSGSKRVSTVNQFVQQQQMVENDEKLQNNNNNNGELFLLYRHLKKCRVYHGVNAKSGSNSRKKGIKIPQEFTGELSSRHNWNLISNYNYFYVWLNKNLSISRFFVNLRSIFH